MSDLLTYLTDVGNLPAGEHPLRIGERVHLRPIAGSAETEVWSECGRRLGRLPPAERHLLASLGHHHPLAARIAAMVPRPGLGRSDRILLRVEAA
jgi:hypothetical protein